MDADFVALGSNLDDSKMPDGSERFVKALNDLLEVTEQPSRVAAPFLEEKLDKADVLDLAQKVLEDGVMQTWSCWTDGETPCGKCGACRMKSKASAKLTSSKRAEAP